MSNNNHTDQSEEQLQDDVTLNEDVLQDEAQGSENQSDTEESNEARLQKENQDLRAKLLYQIAEFENFKKRKSRERLELLNSAAQDTLTALLPVLDDFDRAQHLSAEQKLTPAFQEGIQLVYQKLFNVLKSKGLEPMESTGLVFDAEFHSAITEIPAPTEDLKGKIVDTIERGYLLNGKIIRHAKVVTGKWFLELSRKVPLTSINI